jgi:hypothetical protein
MSDTMINVNLIKIQGAKRVNFGEDFGVLTIRPIGSDESLDLSANIRETTKLFDELIKFREETSTIKMDADVDIDMVKERVTEGNDILDRINELRKEEIEIYVRCFITSDREAGRKVLKTLSSKGMQDLFVQIFEPRVERKKKTNGAKK